MSKYEIKGNGEEAVSFTRMWRVTKGVDDAQYTLHLQLHEEAQEHRKPYQRRRPWRQVPSIWWQWCCCCVAVFRFYGACGGFTKNQAKPHLPHDNMLRGKTVCLNCSEIFLVWWALFGLKQWFILLEVTPKARQPLMSCLLSLRLSRSHVHTSGTKPAICGFFNYTLTA